MRKRWVLLIVPALVLAWTVGSFAQGSGGATVQARADAKFGTILTDAKGMALYFYEEDTPGQSACTGECAQNWPPLTVAGTPTLASGVPGTLAAITRPDGSKQVAYDKRPLYTFVGDRQPGDVTGNGVAGFVVATVTAGTPVASPAASPSASPAAPSTYPGGYNYPGN